MSEHFDTSMPDPTSPFSDPSTSDGIEEDGDLSHLPPVHQDALRRLRTKVQEAAAHIRQLEEENEQLRQQVRELEKRPAISPDKTAVALDPNPDALRDQISRFVEAIDTYLAEGTVETEERQPESADETTP